jgi:hypothetical protein
MPSNGTLAAAVSTHEVVPATNLLGMDFCFQNVWFSDYWISHPEIQ